MKTLTAVLTIMFLSAGAFAENSRPMVRAVMAENANVTVIAKNQSWPPKGRITVETCTISRCIDI
jgi:hypothetical protein